MEDADEVPAAYTATDDDRSKHREYHREMRDRMADSDRQTDQAVLTLSSAALGISLAFIGNRADSLVPIVLVGSWACFGGAILMTLASIQASRSAMQAMIDRSEPFYLLGRKNAYDDPIPELERVVHMNHAALSLFALGIALTIVFVAINIL